jgi:hypothetical protein
MQNGMLSPSLLAAHEMILATAAGLSATENGFIDHNRE